MRILFENVGVFNRFWISEVDYISHKILEREVRNQCPEMIKPLHFGNGNIYNQAQTIEGKYFILRENTDDKYNPCRFCKSINTDIRISTDNKPPDKKVTILTRKCNDCGKIAVLKMWYDR